MLKIVLYALLCISVPRFIRAGEEITPAEQRVSAYFMQDTRFPTAIIQLICTYCKPTPAQPILIIDAEDLLYHHQRCAALDDSLHVWVIGKNPEEPKLPLCVQFKIYPTHKKKSETYPEIWHPTQLRKDLVQLYPKYRPLQSTQDLSIIHESESTLCTYAPGITRETVDIFGYLTNHRIELVSHHSPAIEAGKEISIIYLAPDHSLLSFFQLQSNLGIHLNTLSSKLPLRTFPTEGGLWLYLEGVHLNNIVKNYYKQKGTIAHIRDQLQQFIPIFIRGKSLQSCIQYADKRKKEAYRS